MRVQAFAKQTLKSAGFIPGDLKSIKESPEGPEDLLGR